MADAVTDASVSMFDAVKNFFIDEFLVVSLPRKLVLQNWRLATFSKILQVLSIILAASYSLSRHSFQEKNDVYGWGIDLWPEDPVAAVHGTLPPHCKQTAAYASEDGPTFKYKPTSCKVFPNREASSVNGGKLFLPTFVDDTKVWDGSGNECSNSSRKACSELGADFKEVDGQCSCTLSDQFLVRDADEQSVRFVYGYEADTSHGKRERLLRGGILSSTASAGPDHELEKHSRDLVTQFRAQNGEACSFGGKTRWSQSEASGGITGKLNELLVCAGVTLDSNPATLVAGTLSAPPHLRTMGFKLDLHLYLSQDFVGDLTCDVRVVATPITSVAHHNNMISSTFPSAGAAAYRRQRVHGVAMDVHVKGQIYTFDWRQVVRGLVDVFVVLTIPRMMVYFVAMYMMGLASRVHRNTARTKFNIFSKFHSSVARVFLAEVAFRGIVNNFSDRMNLLGPVTPQRMLERLEDIFCGDLQQEELTKLAAVVFTSMDKDHNDEIVCSEFIKSSTDDGEINLATLTKFFHTQYPERTNHLQRLLDDTMNKTQNIIEKDMKRLFSSSLEEIHTSHQFSCPHSDIAVTIGKEMGGKEEVSNMMVGRESPGHEKSVTGDVSNYEKELQGFTDKMAHHEKELQKLFDHHQHSAETLMQRVQELEHNLLQALQVLKEALQSPEFASRQSSLSLVCPTPILADMEVVQASLATRQSTSGSGARPISHRSETAGDSGRLHP